MRHIVVVAVVLLSLSATADVPSTLPLQGVLRSPSGQPAPDGTYGLTLRLFDAESEGVLLFEEKLGAVDSVTVKNGVFSLALGATKALPPNLFLNAAQVWVEVQVATDPALPRRLLHAVPYARVAQALACTGCIGATQLGFAVYGQEQLYTKTEIDQKLSGLVTAPNLTGVESLDGEQLGGIESGQTVRLVGVGFGAAPTVRLFNTAVTPTGPATDTSVETILTPVAADEFASIAVVNSDSGLRSNAITVRVGSSKFGSGADGPLVVTGTVNVDTVRTTTTAAAGAGSETLSVANAAGIAAGDLVLIIVVQGSGAGTWELRGVKSGAGATVSLGSPTTGAYPGGAVVQRVPQHTDVTVQAGGVLTATAWNGTSGGIVAIAASGTIHVQGNGVIRGTALGYRGGAAGTGSGANGHQGESFGGLGSTAGANNGGGGGAGQGQGDSCNGGGGGGHSAKGGDGLSKSGGVSGTGGAAYGDNGLLALFAGSGGGAGGTDSEGDGAGSTSGVGGNGGGIVLLLTETLQADAPTTAIQCRGANGGDADGGPSGGETGGGGGGSGGSVLILADTSPGALAPNVAGGSPGQSSFNGGGCQAVQAGAGADGRTATKAP